MLVQRPNPRSSGPQRYGVEQLGPAGAGLLPDPQLLLNSTIINVDNGRGGTEEISLADGLIQGRVLAYAGTCCDETKDTEPKLWPERAKSKLRDMIKAQQIVRRKGRGTVNIDEAIDILLDDEQSMTLWLHKCSNSGNIDFYEAALHKFARICAGAMWKKDGAGTCSAVYSRSYHLFVRLTIELVPAGGAIAGLPLTQSTMEAGALKNASCPEAREAALHAVRAAFAGGAEGWAQAVANWVHGNYPLGDVTHPDPGPKRKRGREEPAGDAGGSSPRRRRNGADSGAAAAAPGGAAGAAAGGAAGAAAGGAAGSAADGASGGASAAAAAPAPVGGRRWDSRAASAASSFQL
eukprot:COSAG04_NODE_1140_length_8092_cov_9.923683_3_plen_350_part_00